MTSHASLPIRRCDLLRRQEAPPDYDCLVNFGARIGRVGRQFGKQIDEFSIGPLSVSPKPALRRPAPRLVKSKSAPQSDGLTPVKAGLLVIV